MKNRFSNRVNNTIELTSLLDVIFIVLMIVVCYQQIDLQQKNQQAETVIEEAYEMRDEAAEILADQTVYSEQLDTVENIFDQVMAITVAVDYVPSDIKNRKIRVLVNQEDLQEMDFGPENADETFAKLEQLLEDKIASHGDMPVILSLSENQILYRDERKVTEILDRLMTSHDNLYQKGNGEQNE